MSNYQNNHKFKSIHLINIIVQIDSKKINKTNLNDIITNLTILRSMNYVGKLMIINEENILDKVQKHSTLEKKDVIYNEAITMPSIENENTLVLYYFEDKDTIITKLKSKITNINNIAMISYKNLDCLSYILYNLQTCFRTRMGKLVKYNSEFEKINKQELLMSIITKEIKSDNKMFNIIENIIINVRKTTNFKLEFINDINQDGGGFFGNIKRKIRRLRRKKGEIVTNKNLKQKQTNLNLKIKNNKIELYKNKTSKTNMKYYKYKYKFLLMKRNYNDNNQYKINNEDNDATKENKKTMQKSKDDYKNSTLNNVNDYDFVMTFMNDTSLAILDFILFTDVDQPTNNIINRFTKKYTNYEKHNSKYPLIEKGGLTDNEKIAHKKKKGNIFYNRNTNAQNLKEKFSIEKQFLDNHELKEAISNLTKLNDKKTVKNYLQRKRLTKKIKQLKQIEEEKYYQKLNFNSSPKSIPKSTASSASSRSKSRSKSSSRPSSRPSSTASRVSTASKPPRQNVSRGSTSSGSSSSSGSSRPTRQNVFRNSNASDSSEE